jgi:hypothetical protein
MWVHLNNVLQVHFNVLEVIRVMFNLRIDIWKQENLFSNDLDQTRVNCRPILIFYTYTSEASYSFITFSAHICTAKILRVWEKD